MKFSFKNKGIKKYLFIITGNLVLTKGLNLLLEMVSCAAPLLCHTTDHELLARITTCFAFIDNLSITCTADIVNEELDQRQNKPRRQDTFDILTQNVSGVLLFFVQQLLAYVCTLGTADTRR